MYSPDFLALKHSDHQPSPDKQQGEDVELQQNHYTANIQKANVHPPAPSVEVAEISVFVVPFFSVTEFAGVFLPGKQREQLQ